MGPTERRYCVCGATRDIPASLRIASCVRCGRALMTTPDVPAPPSSSISLVAALASQLLGAIAFCLVLAWAWSVKADGRVAIGALLAIGASWVFAGGSALRGSVRALYCCAVLDVALAVIALANVSNVRGLLRAATSRLAPAIAEHDTTIVLAVGAVAVLAAVACIAAVPQVRRMAAWQDEQIARLA